MAFDPSVISEIGGYGPNPVAAQGNALTLANAAQGYQTGQIDLQQKRQAQTDEQQARKLLQGVDLMTPEGQQKLQQLPPELRMKMMAGVAKQQQAQREITIEELQIHDSQQEALSGALDPVVAQLDQEAQRPGANPAMLDAKAKQLAIPAALQLRQQRPDLAPIIDRFLQDPNSLSYNGIKSADQLTKRGSQAIKDRIQQKRAEETERENRARDAREQGRASRDERRVTLAEQKEENRRQESQEGVISEDSAQLAVDRILNGEQPRDVLANFGRGKQGAQNITKVQNLLASSAKSRGISAADISARMVEMKGLVKEQQTEASIAGRITYAEKEIQQIAPKVLELSAQVPRSSFVPWNKLQLMGESSISDPKLKQLKAYLTTLTNSYDVLGGRGGTDVEKRAHNRALLDAADGPAALKAAVEAIVQEAALSHEAARQSMAVDRTRLPGATPGAGVPPSAPAPGGASGWGKATVVGQ